CQPTTQGVVGSNPASRTTNFSQINGLASQRLARFSLACAIACDLATQVLDRKRPILLGRRASEVGSVRAIHASLVVLFRPGREFDSRWPMCSRAAERGLGWPRGCTCPATVPNSAARTR